MKKITKLIFGIILVTTFGTMVGSHTVSADENIAGPQIENRAIDVGGIYHHRVVTFLRHDVPTVALHWNTNHLSHQVLTNPNNGDHRNRWILFYNNVDGTYQIVGGPHNTEGTFRAAYLSAVEDRGAFRVDTRWNINSDKWRIYRVGSHSLGNAVLIENVSTNRVMQTVTPFTPQAPIMLGARNGINGAPNQRFIAQIVGNA